MNQIGARVQAMREQQSLTQDTLCARIAQQTEGAWNPGWQDISRIENGSRLVSDLEILALAAVLGCRSAWLLTGEDGEALATLLERPDSARTSDG